MHSWLACVVNVVDYFRFDPSLNKPHSMFKVNLYVRTKIGHTCIILAKYADNMEYRRYVETIYVFQFIANGAYSVDTFFFISGFLVSFIYFRSNAKGKLEKLSKGLNEFSAGTLHFFGLLAYRFIRLTVPYMYMLGVVAVVMRYLAHESVFDMPANDAENCPKYWWRNIFYINTLFPVKDMVRF